MSRTPRLNVFHACRVACPNLPLSLRLPGWRCPSHFFLLTSSPALLVNQRKSWTVTGQYRRLSKLLIVYLPPILLIFRQPIIPHFSFLQSYLKSCQTSTRENFYSCLKFILFTHLSYLRKLSLFPVLPSFCARTKIYQVMTEYKKYAKDMPEFTKTGYILKWNMI